MKKFFLSAMVVALGALNANAADVITSGTSYYIQNAESGLFLCGANSWGTQASAASQGDLFKVDLNNGVYTITNTRLNNGNQTLGYNLYVDTNAGQNGNTWTIAPVDGEKGLFTIYGKGKRDNVADAYNGYVAQSTNAGFHAGYVLEGVSEVTAAAKWRFLTQDEALVMAKKEAMYGQGMNVSFLLANPNFSRGHQTGAWIVGGNCTNKNLAGGNNANFCAESYHSTFDIYQEIEVPNGVYALTAQGFYRQDGNDNDNLPVFYANESSTVLPLKTGTENSMTDASNSFAQGLYTTEQITAVVTDGKLRVGFKNNQKNLWCIWDNVQLTMTMWAPSVGQLACDSESNLEIAPNACPAITVSAPNADYLEGCELVGKWELVEGQKVIASGEGTDKMVISELPLEADKQYMLNYSFSIMQGADAVDMESGEIQIRTLNAKELAILNYSKAVEEAYALAEYAGQHIGVGVMLYLPAKYEQYKKDLSQAIYAIGTPTNYVDAKEGEQIIRGLMLEFMPQYPKLNQRYLIQHKASKLYMNVADDKVTLNAAPTPVMFHHIEGAGLDAEYYMYSTPDRKYVYYTGENKWSLTGQTTKLALGHWIIRHHCTAPDPTTANNAARNAYYSLVGVNGALGSDAAEGGASLFGNKDENAANSQWLIIPYTEPELSDDVLASGDYYIRNRETGKYFGAANSWGTQASLVDHGHKFTATMIMDGVYTLDSHAYNNANAHFVGDGGFVDSNATNLDITSTGKGFYTISVGGKFYSAPAEGTVAELGDNAGARSEWQFLTKKQLLEEVADGESTDLTFLIQDPNFSRNCMAQETNPWDIAPGKGGDNANMNAEKWGGNSQEFDSHQTIEIPNGIYRISCQGYYRYNNTTDNTNQVAIDTHADGTEVINSYLYANDKQVALKSIADDEAAAVLSALPFSQTEASAAFNQGLYVNELIVEVTNGKLTLGIKKTSHPGCDWTVWDNFQIHTSSAAEAALLAAINGNIEDAEATAITSASTVAAPVAIFSVNGTQINGLQKGINIVKMADGSVKKIMK